MFKKSEGDPDYSESPSIRFYLKKMQQSKKNAIPSARDKKFQIIPAIDILDGKCVRLLKGDYDKSKIYNHDPVSMAKRFKEAGFDYLHIVDLDGARAGKLINFEVVREIYAQTDLKLEVGGGVREAHDLEKLIKIGVARIIIGSMVVKDFERFSEITQKFRDHIIVGLDAKNEFIATDGWTETSKISLEEILEKLIKLKINDFFITDIDCDGTLNGPNFSLYEKIRKRFPNINLVASGGVSSIEDVKNLKRINMDGVILGKAIYEERVSLEELREFCR